MKLSDYVVKFIEKKGVKYVFGITGGAIAHIFDSIGKNPNIKYVCNQHEQASAMAADAYSRVSGNIGVAIATSGPGATNLITGICCSYFDSIPTLFITGQVATFRLTGDSGVRQLGFQETDIVNMTKKVTKYSVLLHDPKMIKYELEKAVYIAKSGRPGPALIDIPDDIQREEINPENLLSFVPEKEAFDEKRLEKEIEEVIKLIKTAKRPVVVFGAGVNLSKSRDKAKESAELLKFPILLTWATMDLFPSHHHLLVGGFGLTGSRAGNFTIQNSDLILSIGSRLDTHATGTPVNSFGRAAKKIVVEIDQNEIDKFKKWGLEIDLPIKANAKHFLEKFCDEIKKILMPPDISEWLKKIDDWKKKYPLCLPEYYSQKDNVNPYVFLKKLSKELRKEEIIIVDTGESLPQTMNALEIKENQKLFSSFNNTPMGYALAASIGACFANNLKRVICITGDGGMQINIQELATITKHNLPIKIFVFKNHGYNMIKETQNQWLDANYHASSEEGGIAIPDFVEIAKAYGINAKTIINNDEIDTVIAEAFAHDGPFLCSLEIEPKPNFLTTKFGRPIEDISPLLDRKEFMENMIIPILESCQDGEH